MSDDTEREAKEHGLKLAKEFGFQNTAAGTLLAHFTNAITTLTAQALVGVESASVREGIEEIRQEACKTVHNLFVLYVPEAAERQKIIEVAKRLYAAADTWMLDELEKDQGLPPYPKIE